VPETDGTLLSIEHTHPNQAKKIHLDLPKMILELYEKEWTSPLRNSAC
jgi:hypothetical protein